MPSFQRRTNKKWENRDNNSTIDALGTPFLSDLKKCLIFKLCFRCDLNQELIGNSFTKHCNLIGHVLKEWGPRLGKAGEKL